MAAAAKPSAQAGTVEQQAGAAQRLAEQLGHVRELLAQAERHVDRASRPHRAAGLGILLDDEAARHRRVEALGDDRQAQPMAREHGLRLLPVQFLLLLPAIAVAQESKTVSLANELTKLLDEKKLDSIAAKLGAADQFVGALYFPGSQLLVVSARYAVPPRMEQQLTRWKLQ